VLEEIRFIKKRLRGWIRPEERTTTLLNLPSRSYVYPEPYGCVLVISPWNYPFYLSMTPLVGAIAAGNCAILKPSEVSVHTTTVIQKILDEVFDEKHVRAVQGGPTVSTELLDCKFDYIFFTGSTAVGKIVATAAAKNLTPVTLELGGKSPCIVDATANIPLAAKRIAWGKWLNAGQTCIGPDYLYVHDAVAKSLIAAIKNNIEKFFTKNPSLNEDYPRIINQHHFNRLTALMKNGSILSGGKTDATQRFIEPTMIGNITWQDPVMREEIFGPLFPVLTYNDIDEPINAINANGKPLALYLFSNNKKIKKRVLQETSFGGGMINDVVEYIANPFLPFGGVGSSGTGAYHGRLSFDTFTHYKGVIKKATWMELPLRYPPYKNRKMWLLKLFMK